MSLYSEWLWLTPWLFNFARSAATRRMGSDKSEHWIPAITRSIRLKRKNNISLNSPNTHHHGFHGTKFRISPRKHFFLVFCFVFLFFSSLITNLMQFVTQKGGTVTHLFGIVVLSVSKALSRSLSLSFLFQITYIGKPTCRKRNVSLRKNGWNVKRNEER